MCGRYDLSDNPAAIRSKFGVPAVPEFAPNADWRPTNSAPVVRLDADGALRPHAASALSVGRVAGLVRLADFALLVLCGATILIGSRPRS